ncbi:MAG: hypothetical protein CFE28_03840 [Alphaproteobacteria bacterium PA2]|nr:MAG: hypothetical protein CFE28_03840 [Alphaproteobacteria bacterium PA2]
MTTAWDALITRSDLRKIEIRSQAQPGAADLADGEVLLSVDSFSLTANNITYGAMGDSFGYWKFFPAPDGLGRIPVWGFATVLASRSPDAEVGQRIFGYLPMSSHVVMRLVKTRTGLVDSATHRAELPPTYNAYNLAPVDPLDDHRALLRPLLMTSFLLDDFLSEDAGLTALVLSSASSKTAMGLAWFARQRGMKVVGLTSAANRAALSDCGLYDQVVTYEDVDGLSLEGPVAYVDFAGNSALVGRVHGTLGDALTRSLIVGATHWEAPRLGAGLTGPTPVLFFAPDQIRKRSAEWGPEVVQQKFETGLTGFVSGNPWLRLIHHAGPAGLVEAYGAVVEGRTAPQDGHIITP